MASNSSSIRLVFLWVGVIALTVAWATWAVLQYPGLLTLPVERPRGGWGAPIHALALAGLFIPSVLLVRVAAYAERPPHEHHAFDVKPELTNQLVLPVLEAMAPVVGPLILAPGLMRLMRGVSPAAGSRTSSEHGNIQGVSPEIGVGAVRWPVGTLYIVTAIGSHVTYVGMVMGMS